MNQIPRHDLVNDTAIARSAEYWLRWSPSLAMTNIHVSVHDGCVTLTGEVSGDYQQVAAEATIRLIEGVSAIKNELRVRRRSPKPRSSGSEHFAQKHWTRISSLADLRNKIGTALSR